MSFHDGLLLGLGLPGFAFDLLIIASKLINELGADLDCEVTHRGEISCTNSILLALLCKFVDNCQSKMQVKGGLP
jgi:hypothetical protein